MATLCFVVKKALVVALVLLLVVAGLPLLALGMADAHCAACGPAALTMGACLAVLGAGIGGVVLLARRTRPRRMRVLELLRAAFFDRPPQVPALA